MAKVCSVDSPTFRKPCCVYGGSRTLSPAESVVFASSTQTSASPSTTAITSSTSKCVCVGAPWPGSHHCSITQRDLGSDASLAWSRVRTPVATTPRAALLWRG